MLQELPEHLALALPKLQEPLELLNKLVSKPSYPTMVSLAGKATGPVKITAGLLERFGMGLFDDISEGTTQADAFISLANNRIVRGLAQIQNFQSRKWKVLKRT
jgi:hypothetical protein